MACAGQLIGLCNQVHWRVQGSSLGCAGKPSGARTARVNQPAVGSKSRAGKSTSRREQAPSGAGAVSRSREEQELEQEPWVVRQGSGVGLPSLRLFELQAVMPCTCRQSHFAAHWVAHSSSLGCAFKFLGLSCAPQMSTIWPTGNEHAVHAKIRK